MFEKGDVYTIDGDAVRWVGVVTSSINELGSVAATEICFSRKTGQFIALEVSAYFNVERPGQRVLLTSPVNQSVKAFVGPQKL